jgi:hypothetical protein
VRDRRQARAHMLTWGALQFTEGFLQRLSQEQAQLSAAAQPPRARAADEEDDGGGKRYRADEVERLVQQARMQVRRRRPPPTHTQGCTGVYQCENATLPLPIRVARSHAYAFSHSLTLVRSLSVDRGGMRLSVCMRQRRSGRVRPAVKTRPVSLSA